MPTALECIEKIPHGVPYGNVRCLRSFLESLPDWSFLNGRLRRGIRVSDMDGFVEAGGHLLPLEWKRVGAGMSGGQEIAMRRMVQVEHPVILYGPRGEVRSMEFVHPDSRVLSRHEADNETLVQYLSEWINAADRNPLQRKPW